MDEWWTVTLLRTGGPGSYNAVKILWRFYQCIYQYFCANLV
jgi:hypothetical protein